MSSPRRSPAAATTGDAAHLRRLLVRVIALEADLLAAEDESAAAIAAVPRAHRASARNLIHYLALRRHDQRRLQRDLAAHGLSSLGRCEAHALASVQLLRIALAALCGVAAPGSSTAPPVDHRSGPRRLAVQASALLGPAPATREARIMVTLPSEAASDPHLVQELVDGGMDLARINCAHDGPLQWKAMITNLRRATRARGVNCRVLMDLAGPKLRTGALHAGEQVVHWRPTRDHRGRVVQPARVAFISSTAATLPAGVGARVPVPAALLASAQVGDVLVLSDARGKNRRLHVTSANQRLVMAEAHDTTYVEPGTVLRLERGRKKICQVRLGPLPALEEPLLLARGDTLVVTAAQVPGLPARRDANGVVVTHARIPCSLPEVLAEVRAGERIWFDDGKFGGVVRAATAAELTVDITQARAGGAKLRADKGINLPDSALSLPCLTAKDRTDLGFARRYADLIGLSFVRRPEDIAELVTALGTTAQRRPGIVLKIETPQAFAGLADILLAGIGAAPLGIMVARGDLAVEVGFARMAEVQEEILWLCEAAHLPVIWGTQVLESLAKKGMATRAEVTDAAMSGRAECVMLNKGPYVVDAVRFLADVLSRMQTHQAKKRTLLRRLAVSK